MSDWVWTLKLGDPQGDATSDQALFHLSKTTAQLSEIEPTRKVLPISFPLHYLCIPISAFITRKKIPSLDCFCLLDLVASVAPLWPFVLLPSFSPQTYSNLEILSLILLLSQDDFPSFPFLSRSMSTASVSRGEAATCVLWDSSLDRRKRVINVSPERGHVKDKIQLPPSDSIRSRLWPAPIHPLP
jgi:hypothetical protein